MYINGMYISEEDEKKLKKCFKFIDKLIAKAASERDRKGYRENLGYDQDIKLRDYMSKIDLHHSVRGIALDYFIAECDKL